MGRWAFHIWLLTEMDELTVSWDIKTIAGCSWLIKAGVLLSGDIHHVLHQQNNEFRLQLQGELKNIAQMHNIKEILQEIKKLLKIFFLNELDQNNSRQSVFLWQPCKKLEIFRLEMCCSIYEVLTSQPLISCSAQLLITVKNISMKCISCCWIFVSNLWWCGVSVVLGQNVLICSE